MADVLAQLGASHDVVLVDGAPLLPVTDSAVLARLVSGTMLIGDASRTRRPAMLRSLELLERAGARVVGVVLTHVRQRSASGYGYEAAERPERSERPEVATARSLLTVPAPKPRTGKPEPSGRR
jgi:Mrp family chromosome partitioning ATPase